MDLKLDPSEVVLIRRILTNYLSDLRMEISDTDRADMRELLKRDEATLTSLIERLSAPPPKTV